MRTPSAASVLVLVIYWMIIGVLLWHINIFSPFVWYSMYFAAFLALSEVGVFDSLSANSSLKTVNIIGTIGWILLLVNYLRHSL